MLLSICLYPGSIFKTGKLTLKQDISGLRLYEGLETGLRGISSLRSGVTDDCEPPCEC